MDLTDGDDKSSLFSPSTILPFSPSSNPIETSLSSSSSSSSHLIHSSIRSRVNRRASIDIIPSATQRSRSQSTIDIPSSKIEPLRHLAGSNGGSGSSGGGSSSSSIGNSSMQYPPVPPTKLGKHEMNGEKRDTREKESEFVEIDLMDAKTVCSWINGTVSEKVY